MILKIFKSDMKKIFSNLICVIIVIGMLVLPSLYAWFNIAAVWDPYANTGAMAVAVVNNDKGTSIENIKLDVGEEVYKKLKENTQIGWTFVDMKKAKSGVESGDYYAAIIIPENFSDSLVSVIKEGKVSKPTITYLCNEKKNAIAPKITDIAVSKLQTQVNETFLSTLTEKVSNILGVTKDAIQDNQKDVKKGLNENIDSLIKTLKTTKSSLQKLSTAAEKTSVVLSDGSKVDLGTAINKASEGVNEADKFVKSISGTASTLETSVNNAISQAENQIVADSSKIKEFINEYKTNPDKAIKKLTSLAEKAEGLSGKFNDYGNLVDNINIFDNPLLTDFSAKLKNYSTDLGDMAELLNTVSDKLQNGEEIPADLSSRIDTVTKSIKDDLNVIKDKSASALKPALKSVNDKSDKVISDVNGILASSKDSLSQVKNITDTAKGAVDDGDSALKDGVKYVSNLQSRLEKLKKTVNSFDKDGVITTLLTQLSSNPESLGAFIATPVTVETEKMYETSVYGNGMAPFYTTLSIWVAGLVLVVLIRARFTEKDIKKLGNPKPYQMYLGRLTTYLVFVVLQCLIIGVGDLLIMGVQCYDAFLFLFACAYIGIVFTVIIYTLQFSFGDIGKAVIVIAMILQIGSTGGLYPVECVPEFFQNLYPYMPFTYAINAFRECISGFYGADFWINLLYLTIFVPIMLLIGLVIRLPFAKLINHFEESKERSDIIL